MIRARDTHRKPNNPRRKVDDKKDNEVSTTYLTHTGRRATATTHEPCGGKGLREVQATWFHHSPRKAMIKDFMMALPTWLRWTLVVMLTLALVAGIESTVALWKRFRNRNRNPLSIYCGEKSCSLFFPGAWRNMAEPQPHKLAGWIFYDGKWWCKSHVPQYQLPLPYRVDSVKTDAVKRLQQRSRKTAR